MRSGWNAAVSKLQRRLKTEVRAIWRMVTSPWFTILLGTGYLYYLLFMKNQVDEPVERLFQIHLKRECASSSQSKVNCARAHLNEKAKKWQYGQEKQFPNQGAVWGAGKNSNA